MIQLPLSLGFIQNLGWMEMVIIGVVLLVLFGRRLPEVGRSLGQGIVEFKKGLKGVQDEVSQNSQAAPRTSPSAQLPNQTNFEARPQQGQPNTVSRSSEA
jgi:sec-independent protein translocase protein TatA